MNIWSKSPEWNFPSSKDASRPVPGGRGLICWNSEVSGKYSLKTGILPLMQLSGNDFKTIFRNFGRLSLVLI